MKTIHIPGTFMRALFQPGACAVTAFVALLALGVLGMGTAAQAADWSAAGSLTTGRDLHTATLLPSGKVLVAGGTTGIYPGDTTGSHFASAELYDPATNAWSAAGSLVTAREYHTATLLLSGQVLVAAGDGDTAPGALSSAELYTPPGDADGDGLLDSWELSFWSTTAGHSAMDDFAATASPNCWS